MVLGHDALFEPAPSHASPGSTRSASDSLPRCDACGETLPPSEDDDGNEGYELRGQGVYHWTRGDERRLETVPLCPWCAAAIGMMALARWEIEEEEG